MRDDNHARRPGVGAKISAAHKQSGRFAGPKNPRWEGGQYIERGYMIVRVGTNEYRKRSHVVWDEAHPDNPIRPGMVIHHMNHDKLDDRPENLMKITQSQHIREHNLGGNPNANRGFPPGTRRPEWTEARRQRQREAMARHRGSDGRFS